MFYSKRGRETFFFFFVLGPCVLCIIGITSVWSISNKSLRKCKVVGTSIIYVETLTYEDVEQQQHSVSSLIQHNLRQSHYVNVFGISLKCEVSVLYSQNFHRKCLSLKGKVMLDPPPLIWTEPT